MQIQKTTAEPLQESMEQKKKCVLFCLTSSKLVRPPLRSINLLVPRPPLSLAFSLSLSRFLSLSLPLFLLPKKQTWLMGRKEEKLPRCLEGRSPRQSNCEEPRLENTKTLTERTSGVCAITNDTADRKGKKSERGRRMKEERRCD